LLKKIFILAQFSIPNIDVNTRWVQNGVLVAGGNRMGCCLNQLWDPYGLYVDYDQTVYIADHGNHRIVAWKSGATSGQVIAGGNGRGNRNNQLNNPTDVFVHQESDSLIICDRNNKRVIRWPRRNDTMGEIIILNIDCYGLTMDNNGYLYISDYSKHEVRRRKLEDASEIVVAGGNGKGNRLDQLNSPTYIFVDQNHSVYVSDRDNHRVMKWIKGAKEGIVVAGGQGKGNSLTQLSDAGGIVVDQLGTVYVADYKNDRVMSWSRGATQGSVVVGGNGLGKASNQFNGPWNLSFDRQGNLYVVDYFNHRVQQFRIDPNSIS
jgi:sugar lactone lactonase YvrE